MKPELVEHLDQVRDTITEGAHHFVAPVPRRQTHCVGQGTAFYDHSAPPEFVGIDEIRGHRFGIRSNERHCEGSALRFVDKLVRH